jgi:mannose-P-dolichol utilization defect protein 1
MTVTSLRSTHSTGETAVPSLSPAPSASAPGPALPAASAELSPRVREPRVRTGAGAGGGGGGSGSGSGSGSDEFVSMPIISDGCTLVCARTRVRIGPVSTAPAVTSAAAAGPASQQEVEKLAPVVAALAASSAPSLASSTAAASATPAIAPAVPAASAAPAAPKAPHLLARLLGYSISLGSLLSKVPQIVEVVSHRSVEGLSLPMFAMELGTQVAASLYHWSLGLPLQTYGENISLGIGNLAIAAAFAAFTRGGRTARLAALGTLALPVAMLPLLRFPGALGALQIARVALYCLSRVPQMLALYRSKDPARLNPTSFAVNLCGSFIRLYTSAKEGQKDPKILAGFWASIALNVAVLAQIGYYRK